YRPAFTPIFNRYFLSSLAVVGCYIVAVYLFERAGIRKLANERVTMLMIALVAALTFWLLISIENITYFTGRALVEKNVEDAAHIRWLGQMALSVGWAAYAAALAAYGFVRRVAVTRWAALVLFAFTVVKVMLVDIAELEKLYRIVVFAVLGFFLLLVAWGYHRAFHSREQVT